MKKEKIPLKERWRTFWHTPIKEHIKNAWAWMKPYLTTWQGIVGMLIAWCLVDGWPYVFVSVGAVYHITWMWTIGIAAELILWQPWMIEKPLVVIPLGILLKKALDKITSRFKKRGSNI